MALVAELTDAKAIGRGANPFDIGLQALVARHHRRVRTCATAARGDKCGDENDGHDDQNDDLGAATSDRALRGHGCRGADLFGAHSCILGRLRHSGHHKS